MNALYDIKEMLGKELKGYAGQKLTSSALTEIDKLSHAIKNLDQVDPDEATLYNIVDETG